MCRQNCCSRPAVFVSTVDFVCTVCLSDVTAGCCTLPLVHFNWHVYIQTILFSESYKEAKVLGRKVIALFTLSKQLLSYQIHYDWGLRALKPVLSFGGQLIAAKRKEGAVTAEDEEQLIIQALRVNTLSKLTFEDSERFQALIAVRKTIPFFGAVFECYKRHFTKTGSGQTQEKLRHKRACVFLLCRTCSRTTRRQENGTFCAIYI